MRPLGSPILAVVSPRSAIALQPKSEDLNKFVIIKRFPTCKLSAVGSNPAYKTFGSEYNAFSKK